MTSRLVVYSAVFDDFDVLLNPKVRPEGVDFVCFTDRPECVPSGWEARRLAGDELTPRAMNRRVKMLPHRFFEDHECSIYLDGNLWITGDVRTLVDRYLRDSHLAIPSHPERECVYREAEACVDLGKGNPDEIKAQMDRYRKLGFPEDSGLSESRIILRRHHERDVIEAMELWWEEFQRGAERDQLSFPFVAWKTGIAFEAFQIDAEAPTGFFRMHQHKPPGMLGDLWAFCLRRYPDDPQKLFRLLRYLIYYPYRALHVFRDQGPAKLIRRISRFASSRVNSRIRY